MACRKQIELTDDRCSGPQRAVGPACVSVFGQYR